MKTIGIVVAVLLVAGLVGFWYTQKNTSVMPSPTVVTTPTTTMTNTETTSPTSTDSATAASETVAMTKDIVVTGSNFSFDPKEIRVKKGTTVKVTFKNASGLHDFVLQEFTVATKKLQGGQEETVTFVADKTGSFEYFCSVGNHREMGMKGMLIVE